MGVEKAFVYGLRAFYGCGMAFLVMQMVGDPLMAIIAAAGGQSAQIADWIQTAMQFYAIFYLVVIVVAMFVGAYKNEDTSQGYVR